MRVRRISNKGYGDRDDGSGKSDIVIMVVMVGEEQEEEEGGGGAGAGRETSWSARKKKQKGTERTESKIETRCRAQNSGMFSMKRRGVYPFRDAMLVQCRSSKFASSRNARETSWARRVGKVWKIRVSSACLACASCSLWPQTSPCSFPTCALTVRLNTLTNVILLNEIKSRSSSENVEARNCHSTI